MKKAKLILVLALVACLSAGCAYLPLLTMTPQPTAKPQASVSVDGDSVTLEWDGDYRSDGLYERGRVHRIRVRAVDAYGAASELSLIHISSRLSRSSRWPTLVSPSPNTPTLIRRLR